MLNKVFFILFGVGFALSSCDKATETIQPQPIKERQLKADERRYEGGTCQISVGATTVTGFHCVRGLGSSCKKLHPCTVAANISPDIAAFFTQEELDNWLNVDLTQKGREFEIAMWEAGWFYHPDGE